MIAPDSYKIAATTARTTRQHTYVHIAQKIKASTEVATSVDDAQASSKPMAAMA
eukprot:CAMPEP_0115349844 /NCGR_PEP_ID=MMETSP0270-20121206/96150_1 /TAXON_ID=71861 /ORGANISM="Scrippsiella trochoidea, Strain CCMP3099" /LENGTH=53 /DNA_ID=CAMNT_0002771899 /DNA_START=23 /DNA_END=180 /DNA_ORIENTATION=-